MRSKAKKSKVKPSVAQYTAEQALADRAWWHELKRYFPWTLYGFSHRRSATFYTDPNYNEELHITGNQRNQIIEAIKRECA